MIAPFLLAAFFAVGQAQAVEPMPTSAKDAAELEQWAKREYGRPIIQYFDVEDARLLVVIGDQGSGVRLMAVHIFVRPADTWVLHMFWFTCQPSLEIRVTDGVMKFMCRDEIIMSIKTASFHVDPNKQ